MGVIYKITSPQNKLYIGKTYNLKLRINHYRCGKGGGKNSIIMRSIRKYGWSSHIIEVIEEIDDVLLNSREIYSFLKLKRI